MKVTETLTGKIRFSSNWLGRMVLMVEEEQTMIFQAPEDAPYNVTRTKKYYRAAKKTDVPTLRTLKKQVKW